MSQVLAEYARVIETDLVPFPGVRELDFLTTTRALALRAASSARLEALAAPPRLDRA